MLQPSKTPLPSQLNPIIASCFVSLALQLGMSPAHAAGKRDGVMVAVAPVAIPLQDKKTPLSSPGQSIPSEPGKVKGSAIQTAPSKTSAPKASPLETSPASELAKPRVITPTTGLVTVESDLQQADNTTGIVTATGNVRIVYPDQRVVATSRQAQYYSKEGRLVLSGDVDVIQADGHSVKAERVIYDVNRERISAEPPPGGQVFSRYRMNSPGQPVPTPGQPVPVPGQAARTPGTGGVAQ